MAKPRKQSNTLYQDAHAWQEMNKFMTNEFNNEIFKLIYRNYLQKDFLFQNTQYGH